MGEHSESEAFNRAVTLSTSSATEGDLSERPTVIQCPS
jgi:hypothetical protein